jgi:CO/xanthine dehydrogenase FAD-binding subunit
MPAYARPTRIDDALKLLARGGRTVLAGGTDFYPARVGKALNDDVLDITALAELRGIAEQSDQWRIGAAATWSEVIEANLPPMFDCLKLAAREVGGQQIQNTGTVAGNLCNASPAADGVPPLLALDASVELASTGGVRALPLAQFIIGPRKTVLAPNEIVTAILVPKTAHAAKSGFLKLGARKYLVISIAMAAAVIEHEAGIVRAARIAVGACSPVAKRLPELERQLVGKRFDAHLADSVESVHLGALSPIDDLRGTATYRIEAVQVLLRRLLVKMV